LVFFVKRFLPVESKLRILDGCVAVFTELTSLA
jgi:hypothetical protein